MPLPSETLLLLSQGALSAGNLKITTSSELTDLARVHITVHYYNSAVRDSARVCVIKRKSGESGVGIFVRPLEPNTCHILLTSLLADPENMAQPWTHRSPLL